jgi:hypothetical protein
MILDSKIFLLQDSRATYQWWLGEGNAGNEGPSSPSQSSRIVREYVRPARVCELQEKRADRRS